MTIGREGIPGLLERLYFSDKRTQINAEGTDFRGFGFDPANPSDLRSSASSDLHHCRRACTFNCTERRTFSCYPVGKGYAMTRPALLVGVLLAGSLAPLFGGPNPQQTGPQKPPPEVL